MFENLISNLQSYAQSGSFMAYLAAFLGGLFISLTPCIYPLIPITAAIIGAQKAESKRKAFLLSLSYVAGIALTYSALGIIAALAGSLFGRIQTSPWTFFIVGNVCVLLGLSTLDVFDLSFLFALSSRVKTKGLFGKGFLGNILAGMISGLVTGPCTAPALAALLAYVATTQRVVFGATLLFTFAMGMGFMLIIVGTFTAVLASLPKADAWTLKIKKVFGIILILLGEYFLIKAGAMWI
ncbi:MAG: hypothetical protein COW11_00750 [Candidatus Omnitrophica bacterium CG12_big_fil_rev_8_21_14_0_65_43_15]|uniref:Cytochrome C biogenesis protein transmembrane domain-containing protein n=1 Tax=Candidatus Taenaricola geysiri TaxID=1974752 RepID=A0A2J0LSY8_9BACT|nr:MAG: hypothetical protein AUJ89_00660 [Candidatus Omnitrophica bacterium CG1_02_43_210]PIV12244.1 MAG: hypothetical protein COS48_01725 [Candidatus Omnitrophica bacterium CG03_land_8_20_14_0_80_43_22]PIW66937.1 MAG: hypothetical protein COW11_00750 [Candidatus Omnitrophica bacterium CG12_big_fil_rev_8_21_14_0_65_43_15]PIW79874.1 MAG: hypothetical protein COZ98_05295 [Candidatus Omnitrophica bacterium CG_4_8_14_3_um_filter_43_15]PJC46194.1 MAG: hypothetical protein CO036_04065 [Candidatus Omn